MLLLLFLSLTTVSSALLYKTPSPTLVQQESRFNAATYNQNYTYYWLLSNAPHAHYVCIYAPVGAKVIFSGTNSQPVLLDLSPGQLYTAALSELGYEGEWFFMEISASSPILVDVAAYGPSLAGYFTGTVQHWLPTGPLPTSAIVRVGRGAYDDYMAFYAPEETELHLRLLTLSGSVVETILTVDGLTAYYVPELFDDSAGYLLITSNKPFAAFWGDNPATSGASHDITNPLAGDIAEPYPYALSHEIVRFSSFRPLLAYASSAGTVEMFDEEGSLLATYQVDGECSWTYNMEPFITEEGVYFAIIRGTCLLHGCNTKPSRYMFGRSAAFLGYDASHATIILWSNESANVQIQEMFSSTTLNVTLPAYDVVVLDLASQLNASDVTPFLVTITSDKPVLRAVLENGVASGFLRPYPVDLVTGGEGGGGGGESGASDVIVAIGEPRDDARINTKDVTVHWVAYPMELVDHFEVRLDAGPWINVGLNTTYVFHNVSEGEHAVAVRAYDMNGSFAYDVTYFVVDLTAPWVEIVHPENGSSVHHDHVTVTWVAGDPGSSWIDHFEVRCDTGDWIYVGRCHSHKFTDLSPGWHVFTVRAYDPAGNYAEDSVWVYVEHHHLRTIYYLPLLATAIPAAAFIIYRRKRF